MPAFNAELYIEDAINSVLDQTYINWELLIINDGSIDSTAMTIKSFDDKRIKYVEQNNSGVSSARNKGLDLALGKYITFLDADDCIPPNSIKFRVEYLIGNPKIDSVHGIISIRDNNLNFETNQYTPFAYDNVFKKCLKLDNRLFFNPCYMTKKSKINTTKFKEGMTHCEDMLFMITLFSKKLTYTSLDEIIYHYRVSDSSAMSNLNGMVQGFLDLIKNVSNIPSISYKDTISMRLKIIRIICSWQIRNKNFVGLSKIFRVIF